MRNGIQSYRIDTYRCGKQLDMTITDDATGLQVSGRTDRSEFILRRDLLFKLDALLETRENK